MKLTTMKREKGGKGDIQRMRRNGNIPAVIYSKGDVGKNIEVNGAEFKAIMRGVKQGCLPTTLFTLKEEGKDVKALVKEIQYDPTTYDVLHLDFIELVSDVKVRVKVPIQCTGVVDCVGVKLGGVLRQVIRYLQVECLPKDIPTEFSVDVRELNIQQTRRLSDIDLPQNVRPLANMKEVAVVVAKR